MFLRSFWAFGVKALLLRSFMAYTSFDAECRFLRSCGGSRRRGGDGGFTPLRGYTSSAPYGGTFPSRGRLTGARPAGAPVSLRVGRSAGLTGHRPVIQHREPPGGRLTLRRDGEFYAAARLHLIRHGFAVPPSPQGEGFGGAAFSTADPSRGRLFFACGRDEGRGTPHPSRLRRATFSCAHPSVSTGAPSRGRLWACHSIPRTPQGEGLTLRGVEDAAPYRGKAVFARGRDGGRRTPHPALRATFPPGGRLEGCGGRRKSAYRGGGKRSREPPRR